MPVKSLDYGKGYDPNRKGEFVIRYTLSDSPSYFRQMTSFGPAFGATLRETPRFSTPLEARDQIQRFNPIAAVGAEIYEVVKRKPTKKATRKK
jgi:hypothetical protein